MATPPLLVALLALAAPPGLELEAAVARALEVAPELEVARAGEAAQRARVRQADSAWWPRVSLDATYSARTPKNELPIELPQIPGLMIPPVGDIDDIHHFQGGLRVAMRLYDPARGARIEAAEALARSASAEAEDVRAALAFRVRATFLEALFARDRERIATDSARVARQQETRARLQAEVGTGTEVAVAQARVRVAQLVAETRRAQADRERARARLASLLRLDPLPALEGELERLAGPLPPSDGDDAPELRRLRAMNAAAEHAVDAARGWWWPTISVFGSAELMYPRALQLELGPVLTGGVRVDWTVFDGLQGSATVDEREAERARAAAGLDALSAERARRRIDLEARARAADAELVSARDAQRESEVYVRVARAAHEAGAGTALEVHTAELGLDQARVAVQRAQLVRALVRAEARWLDGRVGGEQ